MHITTMCKGQLTIPAALQAAGGRGAACCLPCCLDRIEFYLKRAAQCGRYCELALIKCSNCILHAIIMSDAYINIAAKMKHLQIQNVIFYMRGLLPEIRWCDSSDVILFTALILLFRCYVDWVTCRK